MRKKSIAARNTTFILRENNLRLFNIENTKKLRKQLEMHITMGN